MAKNEAIHLEPRYKADLRDRLSKLWVLLADRDVRTARLVQSVLLSFGFARITLVTSGEEAFSALQNQPFDLLITEWHMGPVDGPSLVKAIRTARDEARIRRDIPIIMLTANSEMENVAAARDSGISEFIRKPFSARTISNRIIQVIENPRMFVQSPVYNGPCRRRREEIPGGQDRRSGRQQTSHLGTNLVQILPANDSLQSRLEGANAADILNEDAIAAAQLEIARAADDFGSWVGNDLVRMELAYTALTRNLHDMDAQHNLRDAAYCIKSQAGIFGFDIGTEVAGLLVNFLNARTLTTPENLTIMRKHIDAIKVIFSQQLKSSREAVGMELIRSLQKLIIKLA